MLDAPLFAVSLLGLAAPLFSQTLWLSEVFANPTVARDEVAEFIEICGDAEAPTSLAGAALVFDGHRLDLPHQALAPGQAWVICRDSLAALSHAVGAALACDASWGAMQLVNSRPLWFSLALADGSARDYVLPVTREGESLENADARGASFQPSVRPLLGDFASPHRCGASSVSTAPVQAGAGAAPAAEVPDSHASVPFDALDVRTLKTPRLRQNRVSHRHPNAFQFATPAKFATGQWRLMTPEGHLLFTRILPDEAAVIAWDSFRDPLPPPGPYLLVLTRGSRRWVKPLVIEP